MVDASVVVSALIERTPLGQWCEARLAEGDIVVPHLMPFEATNVVRRHLRAGLIDTSDSGRAFADLRDLPMSLVPFEAVAERVWELRDTLTAYDASYVAVAEQLSVRLITLDRKLSNAPGVLAELVVAPSGH